MRPSAFTKSWRETREVARSTDRGRFIPITALHDGEEFEIARWSRFSREHDATKVDFYLPVPTARFGEGLAEMLDHTVKTGMGKIVTFRDKPRYVLDPGKQWQAFQAARFGVSGGRYRDVVRATGVVQRILDKETTALRKENFSHQARVQAYEESLRDLHIEFGVQEQELRHLRLEVARQPQE